MATKPREQWGSRYGFLVAAIGSAIGLGNIWRFPAEAYRNGGGAFLLPYLIALVTAGLPLLILEYTIGRRYRKSAPASYRTMAKPLQFIGWWQVAICFVIATYYAVILAWAVRFVGFSFGEKWGDDPNKFLFEDFLKVGTEPGSFGGFVSGVFWPLLLVWVVALVILGLGVRRGIEMANKIFMPLLVLFFLILVIRSLTLDGAVDGLDAFFKPDWDALTDGSVWVAAYGQIFFSLSIGFAIMITYASYLRSRSDLSGSAMVAGLSNCSFELLAGIGVFSTLGFMAQAQGVRIDELVSDGVGLAFVAFPTIISQMPGGAFFGFLFFASLMIAGFTSLISIVQVIIAAVEDRTGWSRPFTVATVGGVTALTSLLVYPREGGLHFLDVSDRFINRYGIALAALVVVVSVGWILRQLKQQQEEADATSAIQLGNWWRFCLGVITPVVLGVMLIDALRQELEENYEGYSTGFLLASGWGVAGGALVFGILISLIPWRREIDPPPPSVADLKKAELNKNGRSGS